MAKINITIEENNLCKMIMEDSNGRKRNTYVDFDELINMLQASTENTKFEEEREGIISDILPGDNVISTIAIKEIPSTNSCWYLLARERLSHDMVYGSKTYKEVGMPKLLFAIKVNNNRCVRIGISAIVDNHINGNSKLYHYPFSNVFGITSVCLGGNSISNFDLVDSTSLIYIPEMFLAMPNNNHGYREMYAGGKRYLDILEELQGNKFDDSVLSSANVTISKLLKSLN